MNGGREKLWMQLGRCREHARFLSEGLAAMADDLPFDAATLGRYRDDPARVAYLDQFAYRFGRLQDTMGR